MSSGRPRSLAIGALALAVCLGATAALAHRAGDEPQGLLIGSFGGPGPMVIAAYELPSKKRVVLRKGDKGGDPSFVNLSPDGSKLAFSYEPTGASLEELRICARDGSHERTLMTRLWSNVILWSRDSALLLVEGTADDYLVDPEANLFWAWRPCSGVRDPVVLAWAADGRGLFVRQRQGNDPKDNGEVVWRCDFDGRAQKALVAPRTRLMGSVAMAPDERRVLVLDNKRLLLQCAGEASPQVVLSLPMPLERLIVFWSPDGKWAGAAGQLHETKVPLVPDLILKNLETGDQRTAKVPHTLGVQWWVPSPKPVLDARALVRAALGPGKPFNPPLAMPRSEEKK
jgi:hypothetical protein